MSTYLHLTLSQIDDAAETDTYRWQREQELLPQIDPGDVLAELDSLVMDEMDPERHPCYGLVAYLLDQAGSAGSAESFMARYRRLAEKALARVLAQRLEEEG